MTALTSRPGALWLDTGSPVGSDGTWSYVAAEPAVWVRGRGTCLEVLPGPLGDRGWLSRIHAIEPGGEGGEAFDRLAHIARGLWPGPGGPTVVTERPLARFHGGFAGFFSYDLGRRFEQVPSSIPTRPTDVPWDFVVGLYDEVLAIHSRTGERRVHRLPGSLRRLSPDDRLLPDLPAVGASSTPEPELTAAEHAQAVHTIREHIAAGDIYQANLTLRFRAASTHPAAPLATFARLQREHPAPYAAYCALPGLSLVSTSPECFLALGPDGRVLSRPIKGTRPRGVPAGGAQDAETRRALIDSEKDRAELTMIVDLVRNDVGRVAALGSVTRAPGIECEGHPTVWHLVSDVAARLAPGRDAFDLLRACFPPGSCIGAPKIRAMSVIESLERSRRGPYTGSIGWIGADGSLGMSVAIRTLVFREGEVTYGVGGGIVYDSDAESEWEEALLKGRALARALSPKGNSVVMPLTLDFRTGH